MKRKKRKKPGVWREIRYELKLILQMLSRPGTWAVLGVLALFGIVTYFGIRISMRYSDLLYRAGAVEILCRELNNGQYLVIMFALVFSFLAMVYCLGNLFNYLSERKAMRYGEQRRRLALHALIGGGVAILIGIVTTVLLSHWC